MHTKDWITLAIASYGAVLSTFNILRDVFKTRRQVGRIEVTVYSGDLMPSDLSKKTPMLGVSVTNRGLEKVHLTHFGWPSPDGDGRRAVYMGSDPRRHPGIPPLPLPFTLDGHESKTFAVPCELYKPSIPWFFVLDSLNREWKTSKKSMTKLHKQMRDAPTATGDA